MVVLWACAAGAAPAQPAGLAVIGGQPARLLAQLERDGIVLLQEAEAGRTTALVIFRQPLPDVMRLLVQIERQSEFRPEIDRIRPVLQSETANLSEYHMKIMLMRIRYHAHYQWNRAERRIWWSLNPGYPNDLALLEGSWELFELDDERTLGRFATRIDVGAALPAFLQDYATRKKLPEAMDNTRRWVDSDGAHRP